MNYTINYVLVYFRILLYTNFWIYILSVGSYDPPLCCSSVGWMTADPAHWLLILTITSIFFFLNHRYSKNSSTHYSTATHLFRFTKCIYRKHFMVFPTHVSLLCRENRDEVSDVYVCVFFSLFRGWGVASLHSHMSVLLRVFCGQRRRRRWKRRRRRRRFT